MILRRSRARVSSEERWIRQVGYSVGVAVLAAFALASWLGISVLADEQEENLVRQGDTVSESLRRGVEQAALKLESVDGFFRATATTSEDAFLLFTDSLDLTQDPDSIAVAIRVPGEEFDEFRTLFAETRPGHELTEVDPEGGRRPLAEPRDEHYILMYHRTSEGGSSIVGFDVASQSTRREAITEAVVSHETVVSEFVTLVGANQDSDGLLIVTPVRDSTGVNIGVAIAAANLSTLVDGWIPEAVLADVDLVISGPGNETSLDEGFLKPVITTDIELPGRTWVAHVSPTSAQSWLATLTIGAAALSLAAGLSASLLTRSILTRRQLAEQLRLSDRLAEERREQVEILSNFELIANNSTDMIVRQDTELTYLWVSPSIKGILGYDAEDAVGISPWQAFHRDDIEAVEAARQELLDGASSSAVEHRGRHRDGHWVWLHTVSRAIRDESGELVEIQTASRDVSEQVRHRAELVKSMNDVEMAAAEKARFLSTVSHEIRTPLSAIKGLSELLADTDLDEDQREQVDTITIAAGSVVELVNDLLDLSKAERGRLKIDSTPFSLEAAIANVSRVLGAQAESKGLDLVTRVEDVPPVLVGDPHRIHQILVNLVGNALKFTEAGSVSITAIPAGDPAPEVSTVRVEVTDTGIGIPEARLEAIFEEFEQGDAATAHRFGGTGLGLGISRELVHLMGGMIGVESQEGSGSTFWFEIPFPIAQEQDEGWKRCIIVGRPMSRASVVAMLRSSGWLIEEQDSMPAVDDRDHPVVFVGAVEELDGERDLQRVIVVDTVPRRGHADRVRRVGASGYIGTPASVEELAPLVEKAGEGVGFTTRHDLAAPPTSLLVLAADDAPSNRLLVERTLSRRGHRVVSVAGGRAALKEATTKKYDVVMLDGHMPDLGGIEVTRAIRAAEEGTSRHTPIIALTGRVSEEERAEALAAGADAWVGKPFDSSRLHDVVERAASGGHQVDPEDPPDVVFDHEFFRTEFSPYPGLAEELLGIVRQEWAELSPVIDGDVIKGDPKSAGEAAHRLRSAFGMLGASRAMNLASELESFAEAGDLQRAEESAAALWEAYPAAEAAIEEAVRELADAPA